MSEENLVVYMKFFATLILLILIWLIPGVALAEDNLNFGLSTEEVQELQQVQCSLNTVERLTSEGIISTTEAEIIQTKYLSELEDILPIRPHDSEELAQIIANNRLAGNFGQRRLGLNSFAKIIAVFSSFLLTIALGWLASLYLIPLLLLIPLAFYEFLLYLVCVGAISSGYWISAEYTQYIVLSGCLGLIGALGFSYQQHKSFYQQLHQEIGIDAFSFDTMLLFLVWSAVAIIYQNVLLGFLAIIALEAFSGFSIVVLPLRYFIGFRRGDAIARTMLLSLLLLSAELIVKITEVNIPYFDIFAPGMRFMGTFVYFLGLLIVSTKWYCRRNSWPYLPMQGLTIISGITAFYIGSLLKPQSIFRRFVGIIANSKYYKYFWISANQPGATIK